MHQIMLASSSDFFSSIGGILSGISELLLALGAGAGFIIRSRRNARREHLRTEAAASLAAREAKKALEEKLESQHKAQIDQFTANSRDVQTMHELQVKQLEQQLAVQQQINSTLLARLLHDREDDDDDRK